MYDLLNRNYLVELRKIDLFIQFCFVVLHLVKILFMFKPPIDEIEIVSLLSLSYTVPEISVKLEINRRTLEKKILDLRNFYGTKTLAGLVGLFMKKKYIKA